MKDENVIQHYYSRKTDRVYNSIQFISHSTDPIQGHKEHMDMEIVR
jgi:hypothetical protein